MEPNGNGSKGHGFSFNPANAVIDPETVNKAEFARQFIRGHADFGATPNEIFKSFKDAGIEVKKPYIYSLIQRFQNSKPPTIKAKRGKWYPAMESEQPINGTAEKDLP